MSAQKEFLEITTEEARAVFCIFFSMQHNHCMKCRHLSSFYICYAHSHLDDYRCPQCKFTITKEEIQAAFHELYESMNPRAVEIFEQWRARRGENDKPEEKDRV